VAGFLFLTHPQSMLPLAARASRLLPYRRLPGSILFSSFSLTSLLSPAVNSSPLSPQSELDRCASYSSVRAIPSTSEPPPGDEQLRLPHLRVVNPYERLFAKRVPRSAPRPLLARAEEFKTLANPSRTARLSSEPPRRPPSIAASGPAPRASRPLIRKRLRPSPSPCSSVQRERVFRMKTSATAIGFCACPTAKSIAP